jgi:prephenate dehydrogenase
MAGDEPFFLPMADARKPGAPPIFAKVGIVGLGLIGGSIALAARRIWPQGLVIAVDEKDVLEKAMVLGAVDVAADDPVVLAEADLVILAAPVVENARLLPSLAEYVTGQAVVTDTGSTKRAIVAAAHVLPKRLTFVGGHPLGGAARGGIDHARPDLFAERPWIFTPATDRSGEAVDKLRQFVTALGARPFVLDPAEHDRVMAYLSQLPQLVVSVLMRVVGDEIGASGLALAGRGLVDTTRLASSPPGIWKDICATNADRLRTAIDGMVERLLELRAHLEDGDELEETFEGAAHWREELVKLVAPARAVRSDT